MIKKYVITVNNKAYNVSVEEQAEGVEIKSVQPAAVPSVSVQAEKKAPAPAPAAKPAEKPAAKQPEAAPAPAGEGDVKAPMPGTILSIAVGEGQQVKTGDLLLIFEAMKMENELVSPCAGTVKKVHVAKGAARDTGAVLITIG